MEVFVVLNMEHWDVAVYSNIKIMSEDNGLSYRKMLDLFKDNNRYTTWPLMIIRSNLHKSKRR